MAAAMIPAAKVGKRGLPVAKKPDYPLGQPFMPKTRSVGGTTRMLIAALDYKSGTPSCPLSCTIDGKNIAQLAKLSGITDVEFMTDAQCSKEGLKAAMVRTCQKCRPGDTFFFFFAGHGMDSTDYDGDEEDGKDENYVCDFSGTRMNPDLHFLSDDEVSILITSNLNKACDCIVVSDCCHSGSIMDFNKVCWKGFNAASISGCKDIQTSGDTGKGGICTHSIMLAIEQLKNQGLNSFSLSKLYKTTVYIDDTQMSSTQDIQFDTAPGVKGDNIAWPLIPSGPFKAPHKTTVDGLLPGAAALGSTGGMGAAPAPIAPMGWPAAAPVAAAPITFAPQFTTAAPQFTTAAPQFTTAAPQFTTAAPMTISSGGPTMLPPTFLKPASVSQVSMPSPAISYTSAPTTTFASPATTFKPAPTTFGSQTTTFASSAATWGSPVTTLASPSATFASAPTSVTAPTTFASAPTGITYAAAPATTTTTASSGGFLGGWI